MRVNPAELHSTKPNSEKRLRRAELLISYVLRIGVTTSLLLIVSGSVISFVHHNEYISSPAALSHLTQPGAAFFHTIPDIIEGIGNLRGQAIVALGLILLIVTPITRVLISIFLFIYQSDRIFVLITSMVFIILMLSLFLGQIV
jgi:uncharacterized membrane protein